MTSNRRKRSFAQETTLAEAKLILLEALATDRKMRGLPTTLVLRLATEYANTKQYLKSGRLIVWPAVETVAEELGADRASVQRALRTACERGYLVRRAAGGGAGKASTYELLWREKKGCVDAAVSRSEKGRTDAQKGPRPRGPTYFEDQEGVSKETPSLGERERFASLADHDGGGGRPDGAAPQELEEKTGLPTKEETYTELRKRWSRGWLADDEPRAVAAARCAYAMALREATAGEILAGARVWVEAADAPRYLPPLAGWLARCGWRQAPPRKCRPKSGGTNNNASGSDIARAWARSRQMWSGVHISKFLVGSNNNQSINGGLQ